MHCYRITYKTKKEMVLHSTVKIVHLLDKECSFFDGVHFYCSIFIDFIFISLTINRQDRCYLSDHAP